MRTWKIENDDTFKLADEDGFRNTWRLFIIKCENKHASSGIRTLETPYRSTHEKETSVKNNFSKY